MHTTLQKVQTMQNEQSIVQEMQKSEKGCAVLRSRNQKTKI